MTTTSDTTSHATSRAIARSTADTVPLTADRADVLASPAQYRVLTGDRPTGALHLGHYLGTLRERVALQDAGVRTFVVIADYQVVTDRVDTTQVRDHVRQLVLDYLAVGVDPLRSTVFRHSEVPEIGQLMLPLLSATTVGELRRNPTVKAEAAGSGSFGALLLTYPVHQAADILAVDGTLVPVGDDQLPHIEQTRTCVRRLNERYATTAAILRAPQALLSRAPRLLGTDGRKMSKSLGNTIELRASSDQTAAAVRGAVTDSERHITYEPDRRPQVASLLLMAALCSGQDPQDVADAVGPGGAARLKEVVTEAVNEHLRPIRLRRGMFERDGGVATDVLREGARTVRPLASAVLQRVNDAMGLGRVG